MIKRNHAPATPYERARPSQAVEAIKRRLRETYRSLDPVAPPGWLNVALATLGTARLDTLGFALGPAAFLAGGAVRGGGVISDWPGLGQGSLHEGRDLRPTLDLRGLFKAALAAQLGLGEAAIETEVFPDSRAIKPLEGILS